MCRVGSGERLFRMYYWWDPLRRLFNARVVSRSICTAKVWFPPALFRVSSIRACSISFKVGNRSGKIISGPPWGDSDSWLTSPWPSLGLTIRRGRDGDLFFFTGKGLAGVSPEDWIYKRGKSFPWTSSNLYAQPMGFSFIILTPREGQ